MKSAETKKAAAETAETTPETFSGEQVQKIICQVVKEAAEIVLRLVTDPEESMAAIGEMSDLAITSPGGYEKKITENKYAENK